VTSDPSGRWKKAALDLTRDILQQVSGYRKDVANEKEDALGPLRRMMGKVASLKEAVNEAKGTPEEEGLRDLGQKLGMAKRELMSLGWDLITSQDPSLAAEAHELVREAEDAIRSGQREIKAALGRLGVASDLSETGCLDVLLPARGPIAGGRGEKPLGPPPNAPGNGTPAQAWEQGL
jgi:hypothetical protein